MTTEIYADAVREDQAANEAAKQADAEHINERYVHLLSLENPSEQEVSEMLEIASESGITPERIGADGRLLQQYLRLRSLYDRRDALSEKTKHLREEVRQMKERHALEERALGVAKDRISQESRLANRASYELDQLRKKRPGLFTKDAVPLWRGPIKRVVDTSEASVEATVKVLHDEAIGSTERVALIKQALKSAYGVTVKAQKQYESEESPTRYKSRRPVFYAMTFTATGDTLYTGAEWIAKAMGVLESGFGAHVQ